MRLRLGYVLLFVGLASLFGYFAWTLATAMRRPGSWTGGSGFIMAAIVLGVLGTGALTGVLMWLSFYSSRKGFDEAPKWEDGEGED